MRKLGISLFAIMLILTGCKGGNLSSITSRTELPTLGFEYDESADWYNYEVENDEGHYVVNYDNDRGEDRVFISEFIISDSDYKAGIKISGTGAYECYSKIDGETEYYETIAECEDIYNQITDYADSQDFTEQFYAALSVFENETGVDVVYE